MGKRPNKQIKRDYEKIRVVVEITKASNIAELAQELEMTPSQIHTSLQAHPRVKQRVLKRLEQNRANKPKQVKIAQPVLKNYLIDVSVVRVENLQQILADKPIILTDVVIAELEKIQHMRDFRGLNARMLLRKVLEDTKCKIAKIQEEKHSIEQSILKYGVDNKDNVILLTSNSVLTLNARSFLVEVEYVRPSKIELYSKRGKLYGSEMEDGKLIFTNFENRYRKTIIVDTDNKEHRTGKYELKIGDNVLTASIKQDYIAFAHYKIVSLEKEQNIALIYAKRISSEQDLSALPQEYKAFMFEFQAAKMA